LLHAWHLQVNLDVFGATSFFLDVHDGFSTTTNQTVFSPKRSISRAACRFTTTSWTRRMFVEFVMSLKLFGNVFGDVGEFVNCEFTMMKLNDFSFGMLRIRVTPLLFSRRDKCKKTDIAECMLHEQLTLLSSFPVWKRIEFLSVKAVVWGEPVFLVLKHSPWWRPTPTLRSRAAGGCK
jgi:hypothetical protein